MLMDIYYAGWVLLAIDCTIRAVVWTVYRLPEVSFWASPDAKNPHTQLDPTGARIWRILYWVDALVVAPAIFIPVIYSFWG